MIDYSRFPDQPLDPEDMPFANFSESVFPAYEVLSATKSCGCGRLACKRGKAPVGPEYGRCLPSCVADELHSVVMEQKRLAGWVPWYQTEAFKEALRLQKEFQAV